MNKKLYKLMNWPEIEEIVYADGVSPHRILGCHKVGGNFLIQTFFPGAQSVVIHPEREEGSFPMELADEEGFFAALIPARKEAFRYSYHVTYPDGTVEDVYDPYLFEPLIDREDIIQFNSGIHYHIYKKLGAHPMTRDGILGVNFAVWAPDATRLSVIGTFNAWDGRRHQMTRVDPCGIFELFVPQAKAGDAYQFELRLKDGNIIRKADPYAFACKDESGALSVVCETIKDDFPWTDERYMEARKKRSFTGKPFSVCELSLDAFAEAFRKEGTPYTYRDMASDLVKYLQQYAFHAVELQPVVEHGVNPFEVTAHYAIKGAYGTREDFMALIDALHAADISVILEWTPTFFAERDYGLSFFDGAPLYEYGDLTKMRQKTSGYLTFDFGRKQVCNYLLSNALYFATYFHIDGLRFTDISKAIYLDYDRSPEEWHPNVYGGNENLEAIEFIKQMNISMRKFDPGFLMITKETACWPQVTEAIDDGGLGFTYKWNNGWSRDFLQFLRNDPAYRGAHLGELTFSLIYAFSEHYILAFAHEDAEQGYTTIIENMPGNEEARWANLRLAFTSMFVYPGKKMLFMDPVKNAKGKDAQMVLFVEALNYLYATHPALYELDDVEAGFEWINANNAEASTLTFVRKGKKDKDTLLVVVNFAGIEQDLVVGVPFDGKYHVIFTSEDLSFGGNEPGNADALNAVRKDVDGREFAIRVHVPALSVTIFDYTAYTVKERAIRKIKQETEYQRELELEKNAAALEEAHRAEEEKLLAELHARQKKEKEQKAKEIEEKYLKLEAEQIKEAGKDTPAKGTKKK